MSGEKPRKTTAIADVIAKRRDNIAARRETWALVRRIAFLALAVWLMLNYVFMVTQVPGQGMYPALKDGDVALIFRLQQDYMRGDVIAYRVDGKLHFGRIAAQAGDELLIDADGNMLVNGQLPAEEILFPTYAKDGEGLRCVVPEGHVYVLGDYRTRTEDSRDFGPIPMADVEGKLITLLRRRKL